MPEKENNPRRLIETKTTQKEIKVEEINKAGRSRRIYGDIEKLAESIKQKGLIQPIAVSEYDEPYHGFKYYLLVGGRRLKAVEMIGLEKIKAHVYPGNLDGFEIRSIELSENIVRKDLEDAERIRMLKQVHDLYIDKYGPKKSTAKNAKGHSVSDTARLLGISESGARDNLKIADWLDEIPDLAKLGTRKKIKEAIEKAKKEVRREKRFKGIKKMEVTADIKTFEKRYEILDFHKGFEKIPEESVDLVEIDIDYPMDVEKNLHKNIKRAKSSKEYLAISKEDYPKLMKQALQDAYRVLDKDSWCLVWFGREYFSRLQEWSKEVGFKVSWYTGKWYKTENYAHSYVPYYTLGHTMEEFFYLRKGNARIIKPHPDTFTHKPDATSQRTNPFEKPVDVYREIFETFLDKKSRVHIPFVGSGNSLIAGLHLELDITGTDLSETQKKDFIYNLRLRQMGKKGGKNG